MSKDKEKHNTGDVQPGTTVVTDASLDVFEHDEVDEHPSLTIPEALVLHGGKVGGILDIIGSLIKNNSLAIAIKIITLITDRSTTLGTLYDAIQEAIKGVWGDSLPVPPKRVQYAGKKPTRAEIMAHLQASVLNVSFLPAPLIGMLISLAVQFGLPFIEKLIQHFIDNQAKGLKY